MRVEARYPLSAILLATRLFLTAVWETTGYFWSQKQLSITHLFCLYCAASSQCLKMATTPYCLYCFESLSSSLDNREPRTLTRVEELWEQYKQQQAGVPDPTEDDAEDMDRDDVGEEEDEDENDIDPIPASLKPPSFSRLQIPSPSSGSSASTPSSLSATSSQAALGASSKSSSNSSFFSFGRRSNNTPSRPHEEFPLFITWDTVNSRGHKSLRGCIGTFEAQEIENGLKSYALTS